MLKPIRNIIITKASGERTSFNVERLRRSLVRSGASDLDVSKIITELEGMLYNGITTKEIYKKAFALLRKSSRPVAARYKLKKAIYELGPTGFPFEKFVADILKHEGFQVKTDVIANGHCVNHEVDVVAEKGEKHYMVECKFHADQGKFCNVKIPLYIHSRFCDVEKQWKQRPGHGTKFHQGWIFTNTRFTTDAIKYGNCSGLMLIGWDQPRNGSLRDRIDMAGLHPVTCLTTLTNFEKRRLLNMEIILCMELCHHPELLTSIGISEQRQKKILVEANELCGV